MSIIKEKIEKIYIAGASSRGRTAREYLEYLYPEVKVAAFLVSPEMTDNDEITDGIPVLTIRPDSGIDNTCRVYIGTRGINHDKLSAELKEIGFQPENIIPVSVDLDISLRNRYVKKKYDEAGRDFVKFEELSNRIEGERKPGSDSKLSACVYAASSIFDGKLTDQYEPLAEERTLQVGAGLTDQRLAGAAETDNTGDNISEMNRQFCELTGLYWIWKNAPGDIVGLVHYRRHFLLPPDWKEIFDKNEVDVILPVPLCVVPSVEENYRQRHIPEDWDNMMGYVKDNHPEDYEAMRAFFKEGLYSPCNMLIARAGVLSDLCSWLFPIVFDVARKGGRRYDKYQNRYPGFLSERLISYFFSGRQGRYKVVYADKNFLN